MFQMKLAKHEFSYTMINYKCKFLSTQGPAIDTAVNCCQKWSICPILWSTSCEWEPLPLSTRYNYTLLKLANL